MSHSFVLQGQPVSKKNTWGLAPSRKTRYGVRIVQRSRDVKSYVEAVRIQFLFQAKRQGFALIPKGVGVALRFKVYFRSSQGSMDEHNAIETLLDALQGVCYDNDLQVVGIFHPPMRLIDDKQPRIEIEVQRASEAERDPRWR